MQWQIFQLLKELEPAGGVYSLIQLAERIKGKKEGVKSAVAVLRKVGAFRSYEVVRTREVQGIAFTLDHSKVFVEISASKSRGISNRLPLTVRGRGQAIPLYGPAGASLQKPTV